MKGETVTNFRQFNCRCLSALRNDFILMNIDSGDLRLLTRFSIRMLSYSLVVLKLTERLRLQRHKHETTLYMEKEA